MKTFFHFPGNRIRHSIMDSLLDNQNITAALLHNILKRENNNPCSYYAVHKSLQWMHAKRIVKKTNKSYSLNEEWVNNVHEVASNAKTKLEHLARVILSK